MSTLGKCFDIMGDGLVFGDVEEDVRRKVTHEVCVKFEQTVSQIRHDREGRTMVEFEPGIDEDLADEAYDFANALAQKYDLTLTYPNEIGS